jgi:hypothetical protein
MHFGSFYIRAKEIVAHKSTADTFARGFIRVLDPRRRSLPAAGSGDMSEWIRRQ